MLQLSIGAKMGRTYVDLAERQVCKKRNKFSGAREAAYERNDAEPPMCGSTPTLRPGRMSFMHDASVELHRLRHNIATATNGSFTRLSAVVTDHNNRIELPTTMYPNHRAPTMRKLVIKRSQAPHHGR